MCKEQRLRGDSAEAARDIESDAREVLEKEIIELKSQNSTLQQAQNLCKNDNELLRISELEEENRRLKQVLGEERKKITLEKKTVDEEKNKALEMQKILRSETQKSEEYRKVADTERKEANDWRASCERLRSEVNDVRAQLTAQLKKTEEALKSAEAEKLKASREKKRADSEKSLGVKNKTLIEVERNKILEEKNRAENLFAKLEEQKKLNEDLRSSIQVEKKNAIEEKKRADNLFQMLEEERKRNVSLQRKPNEVGAARDAVSSGKYGQQFVARASESVNVKLLKEKLKLKKEQLKHAKNVAKLDKAKNAMIRREFQRIKQDWMQLLSRFNTLDDHLAGGIEGIHALTEGFPPSATMANIRVVSSLHEVNVALQEMGINAINQADQVQFLLHDKASLQDAAEMKLRARPGMYGFKLVNSELLDCKYAAFLKMEKHYKTMLNARMVQCDQELQLLDASITELKVLMLSTDDQISHAGPPIEERNGGVQHMLYPNPPFPEYPAYEFGTANKLVPYQPAYATDEQRNVALSRDKRAQRAVWNTNLRLLEVEKSVLEEKKIELQRRLSAEFMKVKEDLSDLGVGYANYQFLTAKIRHRESIRDAEVGQELLHR